MTTRNITMFRLGNHGKPNLNGLNVDLSRLHTGWGVRSNVKHTTFEFDIHHPTAWAEYEQCFTNDNSAEKN